MILFCCAKRSISPSKAETSAKRSRSFYGRNSTAQKPQNQRLYTPFFSPWFFIKSASLFCEAVLSGRTERLTQWNKTVLLSGKIPFLFSSICQIPFRLFFGCFVWLHRVFCSVLLPAVPVLPLARPLRGAFYCKDGFP